MSSYLFCKKKKKEEGAKKVFRAEKVFSRRVFLKRGYFIVVVVAKVVQLPLEKKLFMKWAKLEVANDAVFPKKERVKKYSYKA